MKNKSSKKISSIYATAWYEAVVKNDKVEEAFKDSESLDLFLDNEMIKSLSSPILPNKFVKEIIDEIASKLSLDSNTKNMLNLLSDNGRIAYAKDVVCAFKSLYYTKNGFTEVVIQTVQQLNRKQNDDLISSLESLLDKKIVVKYEIRPEILGGLKVVYGSNQIDDSIKGKLDYLEAVMKGSE